MSAIICLSAGLPLNALSPLARIADPAGHLIFRNLVAQEERTGRDGLGAHAPAPGDTAPSIVYPGPSLEAAEDHVGPTGSAQWLVFTCGAQAALVAWFDADPTASADSVLARWQGDVCRALALHERFPDRVFLIDAMEPAQDWAFFWAAHFPAVIRPDIRLNVVRAESAGLAQRMAKQLLQRQEAALALEERLAEVLALQTETLEARAQDALAPAGPFAPVQRALQAVQDVRRIRGRVESNDDAPSEVENASSGYASESAALDLTFGRLQSELRLLDGAFSSLRGERDELAARNEALAAHLLYLTQQGGQSAAGLQVSPDYRGASLDSLYAAQLEQEIQDMRQRLEQERAAILKLFGKLGFGFPAVLDWRTSLSIRQTAGLPELTILVSEIESALLPVKTATLKIAERHGQASVSVELAGASGNRRGGAVEFLVSERGMEPAEDCKASTWLTAQSLLRVVLAAIERGDLGGQPAGDALARWRGALDPLRNAFRERSNRLYFDELKLSHLQQKLDDWYVEGEFVRAYINGAFTDSLYFFVHFFSEAGELSPVIEFRQSAGGPFQGLGQRLGEAEQIDPVRIGFGSQNGSDVIPFAELPAQDAAVAKALISAPGFRFPTPEHAYLPEGVISAGLVFFGFRFDPSRSRQTGAEVEILPAGNEGPGPAMYGPYKRFRPGSYSITAHLAVDAEKVRRADMRGDVAIDVYIPALDLVVGAVTVSAKDLRGRSELQLTLVWRQEWSEAVAEIRLHQRSSLPFMLSAISVEAMSRRL